MPGQGREARAGAEAGAGAGACWRGAVCIEGRDGTGGARGGRSTMRTDCRRGVELAACSRGNILPVGWLVLAVAIVRAAASESTSRRDSHTPALQSRSAAYRASSQGAEM